MRFPKDILFYAATLLSGLGVTEAAHSAPKVLYVGDSIAVETADTVGWWTKNYSNSDLTRAMFGGLALCDFTTGKSNPNSNDSSLQIRVKEDRPDVVVFQFVGNRFTGCMQNLPDDEAYFRKYYDDAMEATRQIERAASEVGINRPKIMWVLQGAWDNGPRTTRLNRQYREVALLNGDYVTDAGAEVSMSAFHTGDYTADRERYTQVVPCSSFERDTGFCTDLDNNLARVHKTDDGVHYCLGQMNGSACDVQSPGILRYGMRIAGDIKKVLDGVKTKPDLDAVRAAARLELPRILYMGDSIAFETSDYVDSFSKSAFNATTSRIMWGGLAICDFTSIRPGEVNTQLERAMLDQRPHVVIMQAVGNNLTPCMGGVQGEDYWRKYESDANHLAELVTKTAKSLLIPRPIVMWVLQGPSRDNDHNTRINEMYKRVAAKHGDRVSDAGRMVSKAILPGSNDPNDRNVYIQYAPCTTQEIELGFCSDMNSRSAKLHLDNDPTHYCLGKMDNFTCSVKSPGARRYGEQISKDAQAALGF